MKKKGRVSKDQEETRETISFYGFDDDIKIPQSFFGHPIRFTDEVPLPVFRGKEILLPCGEGHGNYTVHKIWEERKCRIVLFFPCDANIFILTKEGMTNCARSGHIPLNDK